MIQTQPTPERFPKDHSHQLLKVKDLVVSYGETPALTGVNFHLCPKEFVAIIGPNGAGKSTLLKAILGLTQTSSGSIEFSSELGANPTQAISYVPQQQSLDWSFPVTVRDVVMMGRIGRIGWLKYPSPNDKQLVEQALTKTGIADLANRPVAALSGGQKQRVLLARMLARESRLLFLDEPLTGVDSKTQESIFEILEAERTGGKALLMVTHDLEAARTWCSHLMLINRVVVAAGKPDLVYTAKNIEATFSSGY
jgi:manganese/iron transport system ATP-binding protein